MKSLWIVNRCCGALHEKIYGKKLTGGQWLDAELTEARLHEEDKVVVVNIEKNPTLTHFVDGNITYYTLRGEQNERYDCKNRKNIAAWKQLLDKERPDIIEIWGTEFTYGLAAMTANAEIPVVVVIQGVIESIEKYYLAGLEKDELRRAVSFRDILKRSTISREKKGYKRRAALEKEIIRRANGHIISENNWAAAYYRKMCPDVKVHICRNSISESFSSVKWDEGKMKKHTVMCQAANYPLKGLHMLLKALSIVKKTYPDVILTLPGTMLNRGETFKKKIKQRGYERFITELIAKLDLWDNINYVGRLTADEMASKMSTTNCFVMCSAIENISSTLKEAFTVGAPCIASFVGGVSEYATNGENCLLYRFEDYEVLAQNICRLFEDRELRAELSVNAAVSMKKFNGTNIYERKREIFEEVMDEKR